MQEAQRRLENIRAGRVELPNVYETTEQILLKLEEIESEDLQGLARRCITLFQGIALAQNIEINLRTAGQALYFLDEEGERAQHHITSGSEQDISDRFFNAVAASLLGLSSIEGQLYTQLNSK